MESRQVFVISYKNRSSTSGETVITSTAGAGTFALEFGVLSRLTGDWSFEVEETQLFSSYSK
jgi:hypothetical protein